MKLRVLAPAFLLAFPALADDFAIGELTVVNPIAFETSAMAQVGGGYLDVVNGGDTPDRLLAVEADFPRVELHNMVMDGDVAKMEKMDGVDVPANGSVSLAPGGMHVMFMGLGNDPFEVGEEIPATLVFENAGRLDVVFTVTGRKAMSSDDHMDHSTHNH